MFIGAGSCFLLLILGKGVATHVLASFCSSLDFATVDLILSLVEQLHSDLAMLDKENVVSRLHLWSMELLLLEASLKDQWYLICFTLILGGILSFWPSV